MESQEKRILEQTKKWAEINDETDVGTRDAWYALGKKAGEKSVVRIILHGDPPVLTVCNQGISFNADRLLKHITQFGESSKSSGEGIGHKGIGFKSVLEITRTPEIFSRENTDNHFDLCVAFHPRKSEEIIKKQSDKSWKEWVSEYDAKGIKDKDQRLPVLRFPHWIDQPSEIVKTEAQWDDAIKFNTLIRLPYNPDFDSQLEIDKERWLKTVKAAMETVTDEIVILLNAFDRVIIENRLEGSVTRIETQIKQKLSISDQISVEQTVCLRNGKESSRWLLYKKKAEDATGTALSEELAIGLTVEEKDGVLIPLPPPGPSRCFHLFFPTKIDSRLPFLFHAYFEVDAGRTRFAPDAIKKNEHLLEELKHLLITMISQRKN